MHKLTTYFLEGVKTVLTGAIVFVVASTLLALPSHAAPGVRANITYQARLMDASGYPVVDGVYQVEFSLYDAAVAGNRLWTADGTTGAPLPVNVTVQDGLFTVLLGDGVTQLPFTNIDWNSDSLYLGITIGADGEMSPRRPITAVPQAINSAQLGGMSPSSTDTWGGESQFTITQASTTAATSTRSALDVRSYGASAANDFAFRSLTNAGASAFTITSQGIVSSTNLIVAGQNVCLADGTDCLPAGPEADTLASVAGRGAITNTGLTLLGGAITNILNVTDTATIANAVVTSTLSVTGTISSHLVPTTDLVYRLGTPSLRWNGSFGDVTMVNATATNATSTNLFATNGTMGSLIASSGNITNLLGTNATFTSVTSTNIFSSLVSSTQVIVNGYSVCTSNGINCPVAGAGDLQDAYDNGRTIVLNNGHIELASVTGTASDVFADNLGATFTRMIGGGVAGVTTTGFDILGYDDGNERGVVLSFSLDRDGVSALAGESFLNSTSTAKIRFNAGEFSQYLELSNNTSTLNLGNDYIDLAINNGPDAKANMFIGPDGVFYFSAQGSNGFFDQTGYEFYNAVSAASVMQLVSQNGSNGIWVGSDNDPNTQSYFPGAISDLLFRPNTTGGPGTQLYVNTDGTDTGWTGIATVDMLGGALSATALTRVGTSTSPIGVAYSMDAQGSLVFSVHNTYFANTHDWKLWDVSNKDVPVQVYATGSSALNYVNSGKLAGDRLYTVDTTSTKLSVFDISNPSLPILLGSMTGTSTPLSNEKKLVIEGSNVYMASEIGLTIIDAKDPTAMTVTSFTSVITPGGGVTPVRMDAQDGYVYLSTKVGISQPTSTITTIDARNIYSPSIVDSFDVPAATFRGDDIAVSNEKLYIYTSSGGSEFIRRYSIADRENPVLETTFPVNNGTGEFFVNKGLVITRDASSIMLYNEDGLLIDSSSSSHSGAITYEGGQIYASNFEGPTIKLAVYDIGGVNVNALNVANASIGSATVANNLTVNGRSSFVNGITVQGRGVCLSDGTNCPASGSGSLQSAYDLGRTVTTTNGGITLLSPTVGGTNLYPTADLDLKEIIGGGFEYDPNQGFGIAQYSSTTAAVSSGTMMYFSTDRSNPFGPSATSTFIISDLEIGAMYLGNPLTDNVLSLYNDSSSLVFDNFITLDAPTLNFIGDLDLQGTVTSDISPFSSLSFDLGISTARWRFGYFGTVSSTAVQAGSVTVGGQSVCLEDGTNCPATALQLENWVYDNGLGLVYLTTTTNDVIFGGNNPVLGAAVYFDQEAAAGTSTLFVGYNTSTNLIIGGTSSTMSHMNSSFAGNFDGNDLYVGGNIGSASSVYTNGEFVAGSGSAHYGDGYLRQTIGDYTFDITGGDILPATDLGVTLGSASLRFNGEFGTVTSTSIVTEDLLATASINVNGGITAKPADGTQLANVVSSEFEIGGQVLGIAMKDRYLFTYSVENESIDVFDLSNPALPVLVTSTVLVVPPGVTYVQMVVEGNSLLVSGIFAGNEVFSIYDISNPAEIAYVIGVNSPFPSAGNAYFDYQGQYIYSSNPAFNALVILDAGNPEDIRPSGFVTVTGIPTGIKVEGGFAYVLSRSGATSRITSIDVTNPYLPTLVNSTALLSNATPTKLVIQGQFGYVTYENSDVASIMDFRLPNNPLIQNSATLCDGVDCIQPQIDGDYMIQSSNVGGNPGIDMIDISTYAPSVPTYPSFPIAGGGTRFEFDGSNAPSEDIRFLQRFGNYILAIQSSSNSSPTSSITIVDTGGVKTDGLSAGSVEAGSLFVRDDATFGGGIDIEGALTVGYQGISSAGPLSIRSSTSSFSFINGHTQLGFLNSATNTLDFSLDVVYNSAVTSSGICVRRDNIQCPGGDNVSTYSIMADETIASDNFDLAEMYYVSGTASAGDLVKITKNATATVEITDGVEYDNDTIGVVSTKPGFLLGWEGDVQVALAGRVPTKVSVGNGTITAGDRLTTSPIPGVAMKATRPGQIIGIALEDANVSGVIEVFIQPGFDMSSAFAADGSMTLVNEYGSTTFSVSAEGDAFFLGGVSATSFTTHAAFDLAEQYVSADTLEPGDIVVASPSGNLMIQRSADANTLPMGIISTAPGFTLGAKSEGSYPVALAGRVPTKVSTINGSIKAGDLLAPTDLPGVAGKAVEDGPVVGIALESYEGVDTGMIEVFVKSVWYSKPNQTPAQVIENNTYVTNISESSPSVVRRGLASIESGAVKVHVSFETLLGYPFVQVTPRGLIVGSWSTDNYSDTGFDIILEQPQTFDVIFGWEASALSGSTMMMMSDGTSLLVDPTTGQVIVQEPEEEVVDDSEIIADPDVDAPQVDVVSDPTVIPEEVPVPEPAPEE